MEIDDQVVDRIRFYVAVVQVAADCMQGSTLDFCDDPENAAKRQQAVDCAHSDGGVIELRLDCILNALNVEPWPMEQDGKRLADTTWKGDPDL